MSSGVSSDLILQELQLIREEIAVFRQDVMEALKNNDIANLESRKRLQCSVDSEKSLSSLEVASKRQKIAIADKKTPKSMRSASKRPNSKELLPQNPEPLRNKSKKCDIEKSAVENKSQFKKVQIDNDTALNFSFKLDDVPDVDVDDSNKTPLDREEISFTPKQEFLESLFVQSDASISIFPNSNDTKNPTSTNNSRRGRRRTAK